ncbi:MAG: cadmium-translocating P-type ATPase [Firmicutes bacterium]|nr:cadmium-translocating P-type ATPase [Bacillota bacterium]
MERRIYILENLGCAHCAAKMERKINELPEVEQAVITYATKQLCVTAEEPSALVPQMQEICASFESDVKVVPHERSVSEKEDAPEKEGQGKLMFLIIGAVLYMGALVMSAFALPALPVFILAYLVLGKDILRDAVKSVVKGHCLDENFLMAIASIGAFLIGEYVEAVAVVMFFCIGELFEDRAVAKSRKQIMDAVDMRPETVNLLVNHSVAVIPAEDAMVGDVLLVRPGDRIPLDGVIVEGESRVDTSPVTGEPIPVSVGLGSELISGCINVSGVLKLRVEKPLSDSMVTRILDAVEQAAAGKPKIDRFITRFARIYTPFVVALAVATAVIPSLITGDWAKWIYTALTFLVISCPCALVLSVPLAYFSGIGYGSRLGILFKGGASLEALRKIKAVVLDKTGTVTKGNFTVTQILCEKGYSEEEVLSAAASAEIASTHPIGVSILAAADGRGIAYGRPEEIMELAGRGVAVALNGHEIFCGSKRLLAEQNILCSFDDEDFYGTEVYVAVDRKAIGLIRIADEIKADAKSAVGEMTAQGLSAVMLTGDREETAKAVAKETGITAYRASLLPQDKLTSLEELRKEYGSVMFVGDGINDAPVLAGADVGAAMGSGADAAIEAADVVFMTSEMQAIPKALHIARKVGRIAAQNVIFALGIKFAVMLLGLMGFANMWFAIFADTGVAVICILNSIRILRGSVG